ncbi:hypothetical protein [Kutzneria chonburiensis]|uniref:DUF695 domain-containing protein n=1 Tax=Kutzneria chonburiensis TaxID=1483604 RepID=A0ABV6MPM8_9PSEU|nr:hypothetical protein [Kutzneria chonburiensis]
MTQFWTWWADHAADPLDELRAALPEQVAAIHPDLKWEIGPGLVAEHVLCLTGEFYPHLRAITERWVRAAPAVDDRWEFVPARRADPELLRTRATSGPWQFDLAQTVVSLRLEEERAAVMIYMHHPMFAVVPESVRENIPRNVIAWALGEDDVVRWVDGGIALVERPDDALPLAALAEVVASMAVRHAKPTFARIEGTTPAGVRRTGVAIWPLRWIDHPSFDRHLAVDLGFSGELDDVTRMVLEESEAELEAALADEESLLVGYETFPERRTLHFYCDSTDDGPAEIIRRWVAGRPSCHLRVEFDPGWLEVALMR